jgi:phospholipid/cholesterol/gamma-HCH transport system substrate-binding protein
MEDSRRTEIIVGLVSLVGLALLIVGILLGKSVSISSSLKTVKVRLATSGGIEASSPVVVNGVKRGQVVSVLTNNGSVLVGVQLDDVSDLHSDAHALVSILEITGGKKLEIFPGTATGSFDLNREMPGRTAADIGGLVTLVGDVSGDLVVLLRRLDTISAAVTTVMADGTVANNLKSMSADGAILVRDARLWMEENRGDLAASVKDLKGALADLRRAVSNNEPKLTAVLDKLDARLNELQGTLAKGDRTFVKVDSLINSFQGVLADVKTNRSFANAILYDTTFRNQMDTLSFKFGRFVDEARANGVNVNVGIGRK